MNDLLSEIQVLINKATSDYKNKIWSRYEIYCIQFNKLLTKAASRFKDITIAPIEISSSQNAHSTQGTPEVYDMLAFRVKLKEVIDRSSDLLQKLESFQVPITSIENAANIPTASDALADVKLVCNNFCSVVRELRRRSDNGTILEIDSTGDMLYLLKSLLRLYFDAIFEETWETPAKVNQSALLIPNEKVVLVVKKTLRSTTDESLMNDFVQALQRYSQTSEYTTLFYFIYDPELRISQPFYLENQLMVLNNSSLNVKIFIRPIN